MALRSLIRRLAGPSTWTIHSGHHAIAGIRALHQSMPLDAGPVGPVQPPIKGGEETPDIGVISPEQERIVKERYQAMREEHFRIRQGYPENSHDHREMTSDDHARRKRVIYRSKQRGWLEVDLLLGSWAEKNIMKLSSEELDQYEALLNQETIDIFNYVTGKENAPQKLQGQILDSIKEYCLTHPMGVASPEDFSVNRPL